MYTTKRTLLRFRDEALTRAADLKKPLTATAMDERGRDMEPTVKPLVMGTLHIGDHGRMKTLRYSSNAE